MIQDYLADSTFKMTLMNFTSGLYNSVKNKTAERISPSVKVPALAGHFQKYDTRAAFIVPTSTIKEPGQNALRLSFQGTPGDYGCKPNAIDVPISNLLLNVADQAAAMTLFQSAATYGVSVAATAHEKSVWTVVASAVTAEATLGAGWSTASGSTATVNPLAQIEQLYYTIATDIGENPTDIVIGTSAWIYLKNAWTSRGNFPAYLSNDEGLKNYFRGVGSGLNVTVAPMGAGNNAGQATRTITPIVSANDVFIFYRSETPTINDKSAFKSFEFGPGITNMTSYLSEDKRDTLLSIDWNIDTQLVNPYGVKRITVT